MKNNITQKNYFEVWRQGGSAYLTRHRDEREAVESAINQSPGVYEVRIDGGLFLEVNVAGEVVTPAPIVSPIPSMALNVGESVDLGPYVDGEYDSLRVKNIDPAIVRDKNGVLTGVAPGSIVGATLEVTY